ncbi:MAG TPA: hypothetical protein VFV98_17385, partial [Vicinamibacterales bacterium]|nr:hypothetical protein [Vicinamibacterales bacterium]
DCRIAGLPDCRIAGLAHRSGNSQSVNDCGNASMLFNPIRQCPRCGNPAIAGSPDRRISQNGI